MQGGNPIYSLKKHFMKKIFGILLISGSIIACDDARNNNNSIGSPGNAEATDETKASPAYVAEDGDIMYKDGKILVRKDGDWKERDTKVTLDNGAVVYTDGLVVKDEKEIKLQEGEVISEEGDVFDKAGNKIEAAWKDVKEGVKDAGNEIEKGAKKAGDKVDDAVDHDDHDK